MGIGREHGQIATVVEEEAVSLDAVWQSVSQTFQKARSDADAKHLTLFLALTGGAVLGRIAFQFVPSVEPVLPFAVLAALVWGPREGFVLGGSAYVISNFFIWGLQGPWTVFQAAGAALAGGLAGMAGPRTHPKPLDLAIWSVVGTLVFEAVVNVGGALSGTALLLGVLSLPLYFLTSLPFSLIHIASNLVFARLLSPLLKLKEPANELEVLAYSRRDPAGRRTDIRLYRKRTG